MRLCVIFWGWDAGRGNVFLRMFRFQKAGSSKFSAAGLVAADGPAPDALALLAGFRQWHWQAPFGDFRVLSGWQ